MRLRNAHVAQMTLINNCRGLTLKIMQRSQAPNDAWRNLEPHYRAKETRVILRLSHVVNGKMIEICHTKRENGRQSLALLGKHDQAHLEQHSNSPASSEAMSPGRCHVLVSIPPPPPLSVTKSPFLLMTNQNQTSPTPELTS